MQRSAPAPSALTSRPGRKLAGRMIITMPAVVQNKADAMFQQMFGGQEGKS